MDGPSSDWTSMSPMIPCLCSVANYREGLFILRGDGGNSARSNVCFGRLSTDCCPSTSFSHHGPLSWWTGLEADIFSAVLTAFALLDTPLQKLPTSCTDAGYLAARFWKAAGPRWIASSRSCSVTGPHSAGSPGSRDVEVQGLLADSTSGLDGGETRDPSPLPWSCWQEKSGHDG